MRHPELVKRHLSAAALNQLWVTGLTFVPTGLARFSGHSRLVVPSCSNHDVVVEFFEMGGADHSEAGVPPLGVIPTFNPLKHCTGELDPANIRGSRTRVHNWKPNDSSFHHCDHNVHHSHSYLSQDESAVEILPANFAEVNSSPTCLPAFRASFSFSELLFHNRRI